MPEIARAAERHVTCPRCEGDGEEVGAPVDPEGIWLCSLCEGDGEVTEASAQTYADEEDEEAQFNLEISC